MAFPTVFWRHTEVLVADAVALGPGAWGVRQFLALLPVTSQNFIHSSKLGDSSPHWAETTVPAVGEVLRRDRQ
jgi:hypothetical protein